MMHGQKNIKLNREMFIPHSLLMLAQSHDIISC